jgi:nucleotide-binding universal stress UspA family protein
VSILERLLYQQGRAARTSNGQRAAMMTPDGNGRTSKADMLPLPEAPSPHCTQCSVLVAVTGEAIDHELIALAGTVAKKKHADAIHVIYGIEVPRTKAIDADMPAERRKANEALNSAAVDAKEFEIRVDKEYIQSRNFGQSLVDAAEAHGCALLIVGVAYQAPAEGQFELTETVDYVLKYAPCRVWVVRGQPPASDMPSNGRSAQREPAAAR